MYNTIFGYTQKKGHCYGHWRCTIPYLDMHKNTSNGTKNYAMPDLENKKVGKGISMYGWDAMKAVLFTAFHCTWL